jgi:hypothetical protein
MREAEHLHGMHGQEPAPWLLLCRDSDLLNTPYDMLYFYIFIYIAVYNPMQRKRAHQHAAQHTAHSTQHTAHAERPTDSVFGMNYLHWW